MKSPGFTRALPLIALLIASMAAFAPGCGDDPSSSDVNEGGSGGDTGTGGTGGGTGGTGGEDKCIFDKDCPAGETCSDGVCVPSTVCVDDNGCPESQHCLIEEGETEGACVDDCTIDADCGFDTATRCDNDPESDAYGRCVPGELCQGDTTCGMTAGFDYCEQIGDCVCVPDAKATEENEWMTGVCRRRTPTCAPCQSDADCGPNRVVFDEPAECKPFNYDGEVVNVCLPKKGVGSCPPGTIPANVDPETGNPDLAGYCTPQTNDCAAMDPCESDADCLDPLAPVCDRARQICIPGCTFDYSKGVSNGCSPGKVCHALPKNLDPAFLAECDTVATFGQGTCGDPCDPQNPDSCSSYGEGFTCVVGEGTTEARCRPAGCLDDLECEEGDGEYLGYCDIKSDYTQNECVYDNCRPGIDPRAGCGADEAFEDCDPNYKCVETGVGVGECIEKNCIDKGGADLGCRIGEFCAGEAMIDPMTGDEAEDVNPLTPPDNVPPGECYALDNATWCEAGCGSHEECGNPYGHPDSPSLCMQHPDGNPKCTYGCEFDAECPGRWSCSSAGLEVRCGAERSGLQICQGDADCGPGNSCVTPTVNGQPFSNWMGMAPFKVCECTGTDSCGGDYTCNAGLGSMGQDPSNTENFEVRQAKYCASNDECGDSGSCEWYGDIGELPDGSLAPVFACGATPEGSLFPGNGATPENVGCPVDTPQGMPSRKGKAWADRYECVLTSICQPFYYLPRGEEEPVCGAQPAPPTAAAW